MCDKSNQFCYACDSFVDQQHRLDFKKIKPLLKRLTCSSTAHTLSVWNEPEYVCPMCSTALKQWLSRKCDKNRLPFVTPMVWHRQIYHKPEYCYFCQTNIVGHHYKTRNRIQYATVLTISKPVPRESQDKPAAKEKRHAHEMGT